MTKILEITDIPPDKINMVEKSAKGDGANPTKRIPTGNTFTLIATFPNKSEPDEKKQYPA